MATPERTSASLSGTAISAPTRRIRDCCARAVSGHAVAAPQRSVMNSRRLMSNIGGPPTASRRHLSDCHRHSSGRCDGRHRMVDCAGLGGRRMTSSALPQSRAPPLAMEFSFQAQDHNALAISIMRFLVALPPIRDLLLCAKHLLVEAITVGAAEDRRSAGFQSRLCPLWVTSRPHAVTWARPLHPSKRTWASVPRYVRSVPTRTLVHFDLARAVAKPSRLSSK